MINNNAKWEWTSFEPQSAYDCISQVKGTALQSKHVSFRGLPHPGKRVERAWRYQLASMGRISWPQARCLAKLNWTFDSVVDLGIILFKIHSLDLHITFLSIQSNNPAPAISPLFFLLSVNLWLQLWHRQPGLPGLAGPRVFDNRADPRSNRSQTIWASWNQSVSGIESFLSC